MIKIGYINAINTTNWVIYYDKKAKCNPYRLYREWYDHCTGTHKRLVEKYADLASCTVHIADDIRKHNEESR